MDITILGSASASSVPAVGGDWGRCDPQNPRNRRTGASILIDHDGAKILIDMSKEFNAQSARHNIRVLDAVLFTHAHADHILGVAELPKLMRYYTDDLPLYATNDTLDGIKAMFGYQFQKNSTAAYSGAGRPVWDTFDYFSDIELGHVIFTPIPLDHGDMTVTGLIVKDHKLAYTTDVGSFPERSWAVLKESEIDTWIVECNSLTHSHDKHSYLEKSLNWIEEIAPKQAYLTHLNSTIDYDTVSKMLPDNVALAYDGLKLTL